MGWFKKNQNSWQSGTESANDSAWAQMAEEAQEDAAGTVRTVAATEAMVETPDQRPATRQQRKIMGYFLGGEDESVIGAPDVAMPEELEAEFLERMAEGEFTEEAEARFLRKIRGPVDTPERGAGGERIFGQIMNDPWQKQLFGFCVGQDVDGLEDGGGMVRRFLATQNEEMDLRTPVGFEVVRERIFGWLKPQVTDEQMRYYAESMDDLEQTLYGKRFEYYRAFEGLTEKAAMRKAKLAEGAQPAVAESADESENVNGGGSLYREIEVFGVERTVSDELLRRTEIDGDAWWQGGRQYWLKPEMLKEAGLMPNHQMVVDGKTICLSDLFSLQSGRAAVIAYIQTDEGVKARGYYRSNSQGVWRYMPDYVKSSENAGIDWFGKGVSEEAMTLPFELQAGLGKIEQESGVKRIETVNPDFLFAGTAQHYATKEEYSQATYSRQMRGDFYREVASAPREAWFGAMSRQKRAPESLELDYGSQPDFEQMVTSYEGRSSLVGATRTEVYRSHDGKLNYLMCSDEQGRSWVGGVETRSPMTSTGLRRDWVAAGDLATPLYEYSSQADGYGDMADTRGSYQGMWRNYLSKVPAIQEYLRAKH